MSTRKVCERHGPFVGRCVECTSNDLAYAWAPEPAAPAPLPFDVEEAVRVLREIANDLDGYGPGRINHVPPTPTFLRSLAARLPEMARDAALVATLRRHDVLRVIRIDAASSENLDD